VRRTALALSPHLDDAAFSCGGTLAMLADAGWRVVVATLFTASVPDPQGFALACQLDKGLGPEVDYMALRRAEDADAMAALGAEPVWLPFREAPHRGYGSARELFGAAQDDDGIVDALASAIRDLVSAYGPDQILAPQAVGGHVDHVQVVRALEQAGVDAPVLRWRDFPYDVRADAPSEPFAARYAGLPRVEIRPSPAALARRRAASLAYRSQVGFQFGGAAGYDRFVAQAGPAERFVGHAHAGTPDWSGPVEAR